MGMFGREPPFSDWFATISLGVTALWQWNDTYGQGNGV